MTNLVGSRAFAIQFYDWLLCKKQKSGKGIIIAYDKQRYWKNVNWVEIKNPKQTVITFIKKQLLFA